MRVDFHSHVVPGVDDGSKNTEMSLEMLRRMRRQGTDLVVATPHYYVGRTAPEEYLEKISDACYLLREAIQQSGEEVPKLALGYEVYYFKGISQANFINLFTIGNSSYILLELPTRPLTNADVEDIYRIRANQGLTPILAHVERYLAFEHFDFLQDMIRQGELLAQIKYTSAGGDDRKEVRHYRIEREDYHNYMLFYICDGRLSLRSGSQTMVASAGQVGFLNCH